MGECLNSKARGLYHSVRGLMGVTVMTATTMRVIATICQAPTVCQAPDSVLHMTPSMPSWQMVILTHVKWTLGRCLQVELCACVSP